jgi:hypothetical protein
MLADQCPTFPTSGAGFVTGGAVRATSWSAAHPPTCDRAPARGLPRASREPNSVSSHFLLGVEAGVIGVGYVVRDAIYVSNPKPDEHHLCRRIHGDASERRVRQLQVDSI